VTLNIYPLDSFISSCLGHGRSDSATPARASSFAEVTCHLLIS
jgi:hypothetical protein